MPGKVHTVIENIVSGVQKLDTDSVSDCRHLPVRSQVVRLECLRIAFLASRSEIVFSSLWKPSWLFSNVSCLVQTAERSSDCKGGGVDCGRMLKEGLPITA